MQPIANHLSDFSKQHPDLTFWLRWVGITSAGIAIGTLTTSFEGPPGLLPIVFAAAGQQWVLRRRTQDMRWWIPAACGGWFLTFLAMQLLNPIVYNLWTRNDPYSYSINQYAVLWVQSVLTGLFVGLLQWFAMRSEIKHFAWYIVASTLAYTAVGTLDVPHRLMGSRLLAGFFALPTLSAAIVGLVIGLITGSSLTLLMRGGRKTVFLKEMELEAVP